MAVAVFVNVVLRCGFRQRRGRQRRTLAPAVRLDGVHRRHRGLSAGEHMAFTSLVALLQSPGPDGAGHRADPAAGDRRRRAMVAHGAWQQVIVGLDSHSVVLGYPTALLPLTPPS